MKIVPPVAGTKPHNMWRAEFEPEDRPTPERMSEIMAARGLDLPDGYVGTSESPYLAAAIGASLDSLLRSLGTTSASRIDAASVFGPAQMRTAAIAEICGIGYRDLESYHYDFKRLLGRLSSDESVYFAAYCYLSVSEDERSGSSNWLAIAADRLLSQGKDPLALVNQQWYLSEVLHHCRQMKWPSIEGAGPERFDNSLGVLCEILTDFSTSEVDYLLTTQEVTTDELRRVVLLRREFGPEVNAASLIGEVRSMRGDWLDRLLG